MTFEEARAQFPVLERLAYLNAGTFGPLSALIGFALILESTFHAAPSFFNYPFTK